MIKPYLIIPTLIEQPTWGGEYIAGLKNLKTPELVGKKIGQSYELYEHTLLSDAPSSKLIPIAIGDPKEPQKASLIGRGKQFTVSDLISNSPEKIIGAKSLKVHGDKIQVLIKLTQAAGNSYQLHVKNPEEKWLPKPESWYYLEPGLITLGTKKNVDWHEYQKVCTEVNAKAEELSSLIKSGTISVEEGRLKLSDFIKTHNPQDYVNTITVGRYQAVDLSPCGIHHSWEENPVTHPLGNIVYEVQKNVYDPDCTIRSFDRGKIKDDGSIRPLNIEDYFAYIDRSEEANNPETHLTVRKIVKKTSSYTVRQIFTTQNYQMQQISLSGLVSNQHTTTTDSYHHIFVSKGNVELTAGSSRLTITTGFSAFIPASIGTYSLRPIKGKHATILKTYL